MTVYVALAEVYVASMTGDYCSPPVNIFDKTIVCPPSSGLEPCSPMS